MTVPPSASPGVRELAGKVALVTGAARNIGRAIAIELAEAGAAVLVAARASRQDAEQTCGLIRANGGRAEVALAALGEPGGATRVVDACVGAFGRLDMVVANAALRSDGPIETIDAKEWQRVVSSILDATFFCAQAAGPHLRRSGGGTFLHPRGGGGPHRHRRTHPCISRQSRRSGTDACTRDRMGAGRNHGQLRVARLYRNRAARRRATAFQGSVRPARPAGHTAGSGTRRALSGGAERPVHHRASPAPQRRLAHGRVTIVSSAAARPSATLGLTAFGLIQGITFLKRELPIARGPWAII